MIIRNFVLYRLMIQELTVRNRLWIQKLQRGHRRRTTGCSLLLPCSSISSFFLFTIQILINCIFQFCQTGRTRRLFDLLFAATAFLLSLLLLLCRINFHVILSINLFYIIQGLVDACHSERVDALQGSIYRLD